MYNIYSLQIITACFFHKTILLPKKIKPILVNLNLTENCQSRCITCDYWRKKWSDLISTQQAINILNEIQELGIKNVRFTGGETLLRKDFFDILSSINNRGFAKIVLATNGLLIEKYANEINSSPITHITVSLDGIRKTNDQIRGIDGYYDRVTKGLTKIKGKNIKIVSTFTNKLVPELEQMIHFTKVNGYNYDINFLDKNMYFFSSKVVKNNIEKLMPSSIEIDKGLQILKKYNILPDNIANAAKSFMLNRKFTFSHCVLGYIEVNIDSAGNVRPGCNVLRPVGNILNINLKNILESKIYKKYVEKMFLLKCPLCSCGFGISAFFNKPWKSISYALRRIK